MANSIGKSIILGLVMIIAFAIGGTGLVILFNSKGDFGSVFGGFILIGAAIAIIYNIIENG